MYRPYTPQANKSQENQNTGDPNCEFVRTTILQRRPFSRLSTATLIPIRDLAFKVGSLYDADNVIWVFDDALTKQ